MKSAKQAVPIHRRVERGGFNGSLRKTEPPEREKPMCFRLTGSVACWETAEIACRHVNLLDN